VPSNRKRSVAVPTVLSSVTKVPRGVRLAFEGNSILLTLFDPVEVVKFVELDNGTHVVVLRDVNSRVEGSTRERAFVANPASRQALSRLPLVAADDPIFENSDYLRVVKKLEDEIAQAEAEALVPTAGSSPSEGKPPIERALDSSGLGWIAPNPQTPSAALPAPVAGQRLGQPSRTQSSTFRRAHNIAGTVEGLSWLFLVASIVLGLVIAAQTQVNAFTQEKEHPYVAAGISIAVAGAFQALVVIMIAAYIQARTESQ
jgi:hypothetical protein